VSPDGIQRAASRRDRERLERFAKVRQDFPDRSRLGDECDEPDVLGRTQFHRWNYVLPAPKRDLIGTPPRMRGSGRTDVGDLQVSVNALTLVSRAVCVVA
jgi:hypothetical protein